jgi:hypothetical protein
VTGDVRPFENPPRTHSQLTFPHLTPVEKIHSHIHPLRRHLISATSLLSLSVPAFARPIHALQTPPRIHAISCHPRIAQIQSHTSSDHPPARRLGSGAATYTIVFPSAHSKGWSGAKSERRIPGAKILRRCSQPNILPCNTLNSHWTESCRTRSH